jgi:nucleoside-diphosphate-sugar epimerase
MKTLVVGATGATGRHVVQFLLDQSPTSHQVKVLCRDATKMKSLLSKKYSDIDQGDSSSHPRLAIVEGSILNLTTKELEDLTKDCTAVVSCLGHNGMWGKEDRFLVSESAARLTSVLRSTTTTTIPKKKFVLMASEGCAAPGDDPRGFWDGLLLSLIRWLVPPHVDNELACAHLLQQQQQLWTSSQHPSSNPHPEWVIVRPCDLVNDDDDTTTTTKNKYVLHSKPTGRLFGSGTVSRASVAQFMTDLILDPSLWEQYKYQAPVIHGSVSMETDKTK